ncbi:MAG: HAD family hydrolase [Limisphaerales bacterium]
MPPAALIFDFDGTLADTMPLHWRAWQAVTQRHGIRFTEEEFYSYGGVPSRKILARLSAEQGLALDPVAVSKEKEQAYLDLIGHIQPVPEVVAVAMEFRNRLPMAVATGGTRDVVGLGLERLGIRPWFGALVSSEDVVHHKPAPDTFLVAASRLGVAPSLCRAYEDTDLGLEAIRAAGMEAVDVRAMRRGRLTVQAPSP